MSLLYRIQSTREGVTRTEMFEGRPHLVVPVVALQEGVVWPGNSDEPEFVPASVLAQNLGTWNGKPVMMNHPSRDGQMLSANSPSVLSEWKIGTVFNTRVQGPKLLMEAWLDIDRIKAMGGEALRTMQRIMDNDIVDVSVGVFTSMVKKAGQHLGKAYKTAWASASPDHLAILPEGTPGACSVAMGCGTRMLSAWTMPDDLLVIEAMRELGISSKGEEVEPSILVRAISVLTGIQDQKVEETLIKLFGPGKMQDEDGDPADDAVDGEDDEESEDDDPSPEDDKDKPPFKTNAGCKCGQHTDKEPTTMKTKEERISALIASKKNTFTDAHKTFLTTCSDEQLANLEEVDAAAPEPTAVEEPKPEPKPEPTVAAAKVISIEDLPEELRSLVDNAKTHDATVRANAMKALSESKQTIYTEPELKALPTKDLVRVATLAAKSAPTVVVDFSMQNLQGVTPPADNKTTVPAPSSLQTLFAKK